MVEGSDDAAKAAEERVRGSSLGKALVQDHRAGPRRDPGADQFTSDLAALGHRDLVVEAASERARPVSPGRWLLEKHDVILASNTSSIPIVKLGAVSGCPGNMMGAHFFNPSPETMQQMQTWVAATLRKQPIEATDRAGFVVNSLVPYLLSAIRMYEAGYAAAADIDKGMVLGCGHPIGPLALSDLIGLDTIGAIGVSLYEESKDPLYSPPPLPDRMVDAGLLGNKSGHGFYAYETTL